MCVLRAAVGVSGEEGGGRRDEQGGKGIVQRMLVKHNVSEGPRRNVQKQRLATGVCIEC